MFALPFLFAAISIWLFVSQFFPCIYDQYERIWKDPDLPDHPEILTTQKISLKPVKKIFELMQVSLRALLVLVIGVSLNSVGVFAQVGGQELKRIASLVSKINKEWIKQPPAMTFLPTDTPSADSIPGLQDVHIHIAKSVAGALLDLERRNSNDELTMAHLVSNVTAIDMRSAAGRDEFRRKCNPASNHGSSLKELVVLVGLGATVEPRADGSWDVERARREHNLLWELVDPSTSMCQGVATVLVWEVGSKTVRSCKWASETMARACSLPD